MAPHRWLMRRRIDKAIDLLRQTAGLALADVAAACGFADEAHLRRALWRMSGTTPEAFRQRVSASLLSRS